MKEKVKDIFEALQALDMKPTPRNTSIMSGVYDLLREIYGELEGMENVGNTAEDRATADPE